MSIKSYIFITEIVRIGLAKI